MKHGTHMKGYGSGKSGHKLGGQSWEVDKSTKTMKSLKGASGDDYMKMAGNELGCIDYYQKRDSYGSNPGKKMSY